MLEYKLLPLDLSDLRKSEKKLTSEAEDGWEVTTIVPNGDSHVALLKRDEDEPLETGLPAVLDDVVVAAGSGTVEPAAVPIHKLRPK